jgi:hypothetical protein
VKIPPSVAAKLDRADLHIGELGKAVEAFLMPGPFDAERVVIDDGRTHVVRWSRTASIPMSISLIAGDAVHNLRSALDHLAVEIERVGAGRDLTPDEERKPQFPVALNEKTFNQQVKRYFEFASSRAIDIMRSFQPYSLATVDPRLSLLYQVSELDNADKHRMLSSTPITPVAVHVGWGQSHPHEWVPGPHRPFEPGLELGRYLFADPTSPDDTPLEFRFGLTLVTDPWVPHDIRYRLGAFAQTIRDGVVVPICRLLDA